MVHGSTATLVCQLNAGRVNSWRVSTTLDSAFCIDAVEEALRRYGQPEIFNTDQGSQGGFNRSSQHQDVRHM